MRTKPPVEKPKLPRAIWALGLVSLFMDTSSEMVHGLLPVYLVSILGASYTTVGFIEGFGEATALVLKVFSGPLSDWWGKRKPLVLLGYSMGALSKPLFALAPNPALILGARIFDRAGKGLRGAPRDALVADIAPPALRGEAFGLRQSLDTIGAFLGPLIAMALMHWTQNNYRLVFWLAVIPGLLCVLTLWAGVHEAPAGEANTGRKFSFQGISKFGFLFWAVAITGAIFQLARFSEAFLILRAQSLGLSLALAPLVLIAMNIVYSLSAYPIGVLSDKFPRHCIILIGFAVLTVSDVVLGLSSGLTHVFLGVVLWGLHLGFTQGTLSALVVDHSPTEYRGTAFGLFNFLSALSLVCASVAAGYLWDHFGPKVTFFASAALSILGLLTLAFYFRPSKHKN